MFTISNHDEVFQEENPGKHHPWERFIKNAYANRIKTAHNSINNPRYTAKKTKTEKPIKRGKFAIIGNRVTEEFIFCINLVKGLHKYRQKHFESPVIRGVTSVDWPHVWNDLKIQYGGLAYCLTSQVVVFLNDKIIGGEKELKELIERKYTYHLSLDYYHESVAQFAKFIKGSGRPTVYMHISINEEHIGTMIFMLYSDVVPYTCENFLRLCKAKKGGYSGTPVHRIVKDGWIQCGGFGLKSTKLDCENFIVPPDKRGVLCMANDGRHVDCSTQFFVLLQPSPWMLHKYVAFGQLIDGDATLRKIENVETWYESPTKNITIYQAGILNIDCQDIMINRGAHEYIHGHIEDLFALGEIFWEEIIARVFLEIQMRENALLEVLEGEEEPVTQELNLHATARFMKKGTAPNMAKSQKSKSQDESKSTRNLELKPSAAGEYENNDFDVSEYQYEAEEYTYSEKRLISVKAEESLVVKPEKSYYIALTDVPYPGEVSSEFNLKKVLKGDYCLETDVGPGEVEDAACMHKAVTFPAEFFDVPSRESSNSSEKSLDSDQEAEIKQFLKHHTDSASFGGDVVRGISGAKHDHLILNPEKHKSTLTDDELRHIKLAQMQYKWDDDKTKKVSMFVPSEPKLARQIKRRHTGFVLPGNWKREKQIDSTSDDSCNRRIVHMDPDLMASAPTPKISRRPTAYLRPGAFDTASDIAVMMRRSVDQSVLLRLLDDMDLDDDSSPTLKGLKGSSEQKPVLLTRGKLQVKSDISDMCEHYRTYLTKENAFTSREKQQQPRVHTVDSPKNSLRAVAYAKTRPSMSVTEYQEINRQHKRSIE